MNIKSSTKGHHRLKKKKKKTEDTAKAVDFVALDCHVLCVICIS